MSHSFYSFREPIDFEQSGLSLVERHQRRNNIPHGLWSWYLHRFKHQFGWSRSQANHEDTLFQIRQSRFIRPLLTIKFSHTWLLLLSIIATAFLVENYAKCLISPLFGESETYRAALVGHLRSRLASLLTHAFMDLPHLIGYLTPGSDIPGCTFAHGCGRLRWTC